jgi:hypothetical protein
MQRITVEVPVPETVARKLADLETKLSEALGIANNHECDSVFWQQRCEAAERERDELKERLAAAAAEGEQAGTPSAEDAEKRRVA